jgi:hypothetical protein
MSGIAEEASKVAATTVEALKSTPVVLALVVFNLLFVGAMIYMAIKTGDRWEHEIERWADLVKLCQSSKTSP